MKRNAMIEELKETTGTMDEGQLTQLMAFARVLTTPQTDRAEIPETLEKRSRELEELADAAREFRRASLRYGEKTIAERIQHGRKLAARDPKRLDLRFRELEYLRDVSLGATGPCPGDLARLIGDAYYLGLSKGREK